MELIASSEMSLYRERYNMFIKHANLNHQQHQEDGMIWCIHKELEKQYDQTIHGGIVADEMGCGKTFMMISLIVCHFVPRTLIVVPLPLMKQWSDAIYHSCGHRPSFTMDIAFKNIIQIKNSSLKRQLSLPHMVLFHTKSQIKIPTYLQTHGIESFMTKHIICVIKAH